MAKSEIEEINLMDILASFVAALKRNIRLVLLFPLLGIMGAIGIAYSSRDLFESALLVETSLLSDNECRFLFNQLTKAGNVPGMSSEERKQLAGFRFNVIKNDPEINDHSLNEKSLYLEVTARVYNQNVFPSLEKALVRFINESPSVVRNRIEREKFYHAMIKEIDSEIAAMALVKGEINSATQATYLNPSDLYSNTVDMYKEKIKFEIKLDQIKSVHLIKGFDTLTIDAKMNKVMVAIIGFAIGVLCLCLFLFLQFFLRYFTVYETTH
jgi:hypothetical protein